MLQRLFQALPLAVTPGALPARGQVLIGQTACLNGTAAATVKGAAAGALRGFASAGKSVVRDADDRARPRFDASVSTGDLGGLALRCSPTDDSGPDGADLSVTGADDCVRR